MPDLSQFFPTSALDHPENKSITAKETKSTTPPYSWLLSGVPAGHDEAEVGNRDLAKTKAAWR